MEGENTNKTSSIGVISGEKLERPTGIENHIEYTLKTIGDDMAADIADEMIGEYLEEIHLDTAKIDEKVEKIIGERIDETISQLVTEKIDGLIAKRIEDFVEKKVKDWIFR
jgi:hypothetical protein